MLSRIAAALVSCTLVAGCLYDWSVGKPQKDAGGGGTDCLMGGCTFVCPANTTCTDSCVGGQCTMTCAAGSTCDWTCTGGQCVMQCDQGATCDATCSGGGCTCVGLACPP